MALDLTSLTPDELRQLQTAIMQQQLGAAAGLDAAAEGQRLHDERNAPWSPGGPYDKALKALPPSPRNQQYPKMLYSADFIAAQREYQQAERMREPREQPGLRHELMVRAERAMHEATRKVGNEREEAALRETGLWATTPTGAAELEERRQQAIAQAAAESAWDDRNMSPAAQAEREAADGEREGHLVEVPAPKRGPGRPRKVEP